MCGFGAVVCSWSLLIRWAQRARCQAETPLIALFRFPRLALLIVLAFRGTRSTTNWETNLHARLIHPAGTDARLRVHQGFYGAFERLSDGAKGIRQKINEIEAATVGRIPIYITGHSLGGALAQIAAAVLGSDQIAACYTFGSPRVGNYVFDLWVKPPSYRLVNYADITKCRFLLHPTHSGS